MRVLAVGVGLSFASVLAYGQRELKADLMSHASVPQVASHLRQLAEKTHEPSETAVNSLAKDLRQALANRGVHDPDVSRLVMEIEAIFKSAGTSTSGFLQHLEDFQRGLISMGVQPAVAERTSKSLEAIGRQVRGPEDTPLIPLRR